MSIALQLSGITKRFSGIPAIEDIQFDVRHGEVHALAGENGAGKSTLIKVMAGMHPQDCGTIHVGGRVVRFASTRDAQHNGIATVHQELLLFPELSVAENIFLGHAPRSRTRGVDWRAMRARSRQILDELKCDDLDVNALVSELSVANRQRVEIARALSQEPKILIMDEPTAALADVDATRLLQIVKDLRARGVGIVYVSHRMSEIFALADRVTVLRDGVKVTTQPRAELDPEQLVSLMVGRPVSQMYPESKARRGPPALEVRGLSHRRRVQDISFTLHAGEILGIAGLVGSGRTELAHMLSGIAPATSGTLMLESVPEKITTPGQARDLGIAYVPEDRGSQGLIRSQGVRSNFTLASLKRWVEWGFMRRSAERRAAQEAIQRFDIRTRDVEQPVRQLSGGNQQKVVLAKWLATSPRVLILDEPTRGIDVGAKAEIYGLIMRLAEEGMAILLISSELPEVLGMSDRVLVMNRGRITATFDRNEATPDRIGAAMIAA